MPQLRHSVGTFLALAVVLASAISFAEPIFTLTDEGRTFLYRARPGDHPGVVAEMFGIPSRDVPAFLAANGITDPTRVDAGFTYRIPNHAARALGERTTELERQVSELTRAVNAEKERAGSLGREADEARAVAASAESHAARLAGIERLWPWAKLVVVLLLFAAGGAGYTAFAAVRRQAQTERYARTLAHDLEEKRRVALAERQESGKHILDLEARLRAAEAKLGPRVVVSGRGGS